MIILYTYTDDRVKDQLESWKAMNKIMAYYNRYNDNIVWSAYVGNNPYSYDIAIKTVWGTDDLITIEQDIVPSIKLIDSLWRCHHDWCCHKYVMRYNNIFSNDYDITTGLGFTKFSKRIQQQISVYEWFMKGDWRNLDSRITGCLTKRHIMPHIHGKVKHNHVICSENI